MEVGSVDPADSGVANSDEIGKVGLSELLQATSEKTASETAAKVLAR